MRKLLFSVSICCLLLSGCESNEQIEQRSLPTKAKHDFAVSVLENRRKYVNEIRTATNECLSNSQNVRNLVDSDNDSEDIVELCITYAQKLYSAYSYYYEDDLFKYANSPIQKEN